MRSLTHLDLREKLPEVEKRIRVKAKNPELLATAFVHTSYVNEHRGEITQHNERLEFLGDAVLELVATEFLYMLFPRKGEGELTALRSALVKGHHLAQVARALGLGEYLLLSKGEEKSGGRDKEYLLANVVEAVIGALYVDRGFEVAHRFIDRFILKNIDEIVEKRLHVDAKSSLQEYVQETFGVTPVYRVLDETGPDHHKIFRVGAFVGEKHIGVGEGSSKQKAEQEAAEDAIRSLQGA